VRRPGRELSAGDFLGRPAAVRPPHLEAEVGQQVRLGARAQAAELVRESVDPLLGAQLHRFLPHVAAPG
jgi:hypothetical protein